ncbi:hypothetical protein Pcinc_000130 [Petrolisthes cinctipes]|uniref:DDE Tnp4 domain-containing protein n=1 Tax=Petrolisthes cinctipes TaxID=88211 RepID=A0AAE1GSF7_PETCI|nr:hypothetical protein Pcinc_000130 [Petrolisthes cinctipes]
MCTAILKRFIKFPQIQQLQQKKEQFREVAGFPEVVGAIDGTHIRIVKPSEFEVEYVNRKRYHSINEQVVFDAKYNIIDLEARWPGSVHDSRILNESGLKRMFETGAVPACCHLLGDSRYGSKTWLLTPYLRPQPGYQSNYNSRAMDARVIPVKAQAGEQVTNSLASSGMGPTRTVKQVKKIWENMRSSELTSQLAIRSKVPPKGMWFSTALEPIAGCFGSFLANSYLHKHIKSQPVKRRSKPKDANNPGPHRSCTLIYTLSHAATTYSVCKKAFLSILALGRTRIVSALNSMTATGTPTPDMRGRHKPPNAVPNESARLASDLIDSFPTETSHYSRAKSPKLKYLDPSLSVNKMHHLCSSRLAENHPSKKAVSLDYYRRIFRGKDLSFSPPNSDTCTTCDKAKNGIRLANETNNEQGKVALQEFLDAHITQARKGQALMKQFGNNKEPDTRVIAIDLQQTRPLPRLTTNVVYYKRKLWFYNFCVSDLKANKHVFYVWDEQTGGRGSVEVVSCLKKWIDTECHLSPSMCAIKIQPEKLKQIRELQTFIPPAHQAYYMQLFRGQDLLTSAASRSLSTTDSEDIDNDLQEYDEDDE